ncbi:hypothetical protein OROMI_002143 [Orobanche minor]
MDDVVSESGHPLLRRRNSTPASIVVVPTKLTFLGHHSSTTTSTYSSFPSDDLELLPVKPTSHSYTSLKDLLPSVAVNSPKSNPALPASHICIRNRLVKQAAWAYLQPMSTHPGPSGDRFLHRLWPCIAAFFDLVHRNVILAVNWTLRFFWIRGCG